LEVSEALDATVRSGKMRSTIWEWSRSLRSSTNNENKGNTSKILEKKKHFFSKKNLKCKTDVKWIGSGRGRLRPVQNDRTDCRNVLGWFLAKKTWKKQGKTGIFLFVSSWTLLFSREFLYKRLVPIYRCTYI